MSPSAVALVGFAAWTLALVTAIGVLRSGVVLTRGRPPNSFAPDGKDLSEFSARLCRAHANCYETLPVFAALILLGLATGHSAITDPLAPWFLAARIGQSLTHLISTTPKAVLLRFALFLPQVLIMAWWCVQFLRA